MNTKKLVIGGAALAVLALVVAGFAAAHGAYGSRNGGTSPITYDVDPATGTISNVVLAKDNTTYVLAESIALSLADGATVANASGRGQTGLKTSDGDVLALRGPGLMARSVNGTTITFVLPAGATITLREAVEDWSPAGATIDYGNDIKVNVRVHNGTLSVEGQTITVTLDAGGHLDAGPVGNMPGKGFGFGRGPHGEGPMLGGPRGGHGPRGGR